MTPTQCLIITIGSGALVVALLLVRVLTQLKALRRDVIAAGIDIHQELVEANVYRRLASMTSGLPNADRMGNDSSQKHSDSPGESDVQWLERMRNQQSQQRKR